MFSLDTPTPARISEVSNTSLVFRSPTLFTLFSSLNSTFQLPDSNSYGISTKNYSKPERPLGKGRHKIALLGDSLSLNYACGKNDLESLSNILSSRHTGWFADQRESQVHSLFDHIRGSDQQIELVNYATAGAGIEPSLSASHTRFFVPYFPEQVNRLIKEGELPNTILIWVGHNDADWRMQVRGRSQEEAEAWRAALARRMQQSLYQQLANLILVGSQQPYPVNIVLFSLMDFTDSTNTRQKILELRNLDSTLYPNLDNAISSYPTLDPELLGENQRTEKQIRQIWHRTPNALANELSRSPNVRLHVSDALYRVPINIENVSGIDGLHLSQTGLSAMAAAAFEELCSLSLIA